MSSKNSPCFELVTEPSIRQGDIFFDFPVLVPPANPKAYIPGVEINLVIETHDIIVMTQSCVLDNAKVEFATVCPHWPIGELLRIRPEEFKKRGFIQSIRSRKVPRYHHLDDCTVEGFIRCEAIVFFESVMRVPLDLLKGFTESPRLRLTPTYLSILAHDFGDFFANPAKP
ncbi:MAG: hypothetical protein HZB44_04620 [Actinobacteria bacterium]|nr:hypothetical protein [Actinomycetota bacterium]